MLSDPKICDNCANAPTTEPPNGPRTPKEREWAEKLCREFVEMQARLHARIAGLEAERDELRRRLDTMPSTLTEMQDRIALLEAFPPRRAN